MYMFFYSRFAFQYQIWLALILIYQLRFSIKRSNKSDGKVHPKGTLFFILALTFFFWRQTFGFWIAYILSSGIQFPFIAAFERCISANIFKRFLFNPGSSLTSKCVFFPKLTTHGMRTHHVLFLEYESIRTSSLYRRLLNDYLRLASYLRDQNSRSPLKKKKNRISVFWQPNFFWKRPSSLVYTFYLGHLEFQPPRRRCQPFKSEVSRHRSKEVNIFEYSFYFKNWLKIKRVE